MHNNSHITAVHSVPSSVGIEWLDLLYQEYHFDRFDLSRDITQIFVPGSDCLLYMLSWIQDISTMIEESSVPEQFPTKIYTSALQFLQWVTEKIQPFVIKGWVPQDIIFTKYSNVVIIFSNPHTAGPADHRRLERFRCHISETM